MSALSMTENDQREAEETGLPLSILVHGRFRPQEEISVRMQPVREKVNVETQFIACEIHDGFLQTAVSALMNLEALRARMDAAGAEKTWGPSIEKSAALLRSSIGEARSLLAEIHTPVVESGGLVPAMESFVVHQEDEFGIPIDLCWEGLDTAMDPAVEQAAFRILQECLRNACRHSQSPQIRAQITRHPACLVLTAQDWGIGFRRQRFQAAVSA